MVARQLNIFQRRRVFNSKHYWRQLIPEAGRSYTAITKNGSGPVYRTEGGLVDPEHTWESTNS